MARIDNILIQQVDDVIVIIDESSNQEIEIPLKKLSEVIHILNYFLGINTHG